MRQIATKYPGECRKCGEGINAGQTVIYERRVGIFCIGCAPGSTEEIREARQAAADRKAERLEEWAGKREARAAPVLDPGESHYSRDWAFITQPGHIPARARWNRAVEREWESTEKARKMRAKANSLRSGVRVAGDAEARRQARRDAVLAWLKVGMVVDTCHYGLGTVKRINKKTATIEGCGSSRTYKTTVELSFLSPVPQPEARP